MVRLPFILVYAAFAVFQTANNSTFTPAWQTLRVGGGGLMNNIAVAPSDGTMVASSNTYGAYLYKTTGTCAGAAAGGWGTGNSAPCWEQLFTQTSAALTLTQITALNQGVLDIAVCNGNTSTAYAFYNGNLWVTTNLKVAASSRTWTKTPLTNSVAGNQGVSAGTHTAIICDPNNSSIVYGSTPAGVSASGNGGTSFSLVSGLGTVGTVPDVLAYDGSASATTGACAQFSGSPTCTLHFMVFVDGTGVYETYNGGNAFTLTSSGPTTDVSQCNPHCFSLKADKFGNFWAGIGDSHLYKYVPNGLAGGGTWSTVTPTTTTGNNHFGNFALDPTSSSSGTLRIATGYVDGNISVSTNGGSSWCTSTTQPFAASGSQPPWLGNANQNQGTSNGVFLTTSDFAFDASGNLRNPAGIGVWQIASASVTCGATWQADSLGIENMVANHVDAPTGNSPIVGVWDRGFFLLQNPDVYPTHYYPDESYFPATQGVNGGWAFDYASSNPNFFTGWISLNANQPGDTADGGNIWSIWGSLVLGTTNIGGDVAASTPSNWIVVPANNSGNLRFTTNGGTSFAASTITGATTPLTSNTQHGFHLAADRGNANTFCFIDNGNNLWASTNSGSTFSKNNTGVITAVKYNDALKAVPGQAGVFYYSAGNAGGGSASLTLYKITKATNECDTATVVNAAITNIFGMGYGAPLPGGNGFPTIYFYGAVSGVQGIYEIDNGGTTAALISAPSAAQTWPNNSSDFINDVSGDMNVYGRVYVGHNGSSYTYIDTQSACPWVGWTSSVKPNQNFTGTASLTAQQSGLVPVTSVNFYVDGALIGSQTTGTGTPTTYTQSWVTSGVATGAHTLKVEAIGNGCGVGSKNSFSIPITTS